MKYRAEFRSSTDDKNQVEYHFQTVDIHEAYSIARKFVSNNPDDNYVLTGLINIVWAQE